MQFDKALIASKLRRWEKYINNYKLPMWNEIPNIGLYMEQALSLLGEYLNYLPPELKSEQFITPAAVNNYVRKKIMPEPVKKRYYRIHIAYLTMICTLKQTLSITSIQTMLPNGLSEEEIEPLYNAFVKQQRNAAEAYVAAIRDLAGKILDHDEYSGYAAEDTTELIMLSSMFATFSKVLAEKLLLLEGKSEAGKE